MSSGEKLPKGKGKKAAPKASSTKGKEPQLNDRRFRGEGVKFKCKLVGTADVNNARGDAMCAEVINNLKVQALKMNKESGEHKQKIILYTSLKGIRIVDEKTLKVQHEHPINKISFITHDPEDKKVFGYVCSQPCTTGHKLYAIKAEKPAGTITGTLYELFQVVFKLRQEAGLTKKAPDNSSQVSNGPSSQEGIYEVPYKNGKNKQATPSAQADHEYETVASPVNKVDPHYKVPRTPPVQSKLLEPPSESYREEPETAQTAPSTGFPASFSLPSSAFTNKDPDQVSQVSVESPFPAHDGTSADLAFFGSSVFDHAVGESGAADTVSVASADMSVVRSGSVSSGSSETHSQHTKSGHSRSGSLLNQMGPNEGFQAEFATAFEDTNVWTPSFGNNDGQGEDESPESKRLENKPAPVPPFTDTKREEQFEMQSALETSAGLESSSDPFAPSNGSTRLNKITQSPSENLFTESFATFDASFDKAEVKSDKENPSSYDPFAASSGPQEKDTAFGSAEGFVSESSFDTASSSGQFTPQQNNPAIVKDQSQEDNGDEKTVESESSGKTVEKAAVSFSWDNTFGDRNTTSQPETTQSTTTTQGQFSWMESFTSEDVETLPKADPKTSTGVSWDDAFGGAVAAEKESLNQAKDAFSWDDAFGKIGADGSNEQFDPSPFGDPFCASSTVESSSDPIDELQQSDQPASQHAKLDNLESGGSVSIVQPGSQADVPPDEALPTLASKSESDTFVSDTWGSGDQSEDLCEELKIAFPGPDTKKEKADMKESDENSEPEISNLSENVLFGAENASSELPAGENKDSTNDMNQMDDALTFANEESPSSDSKEEVVKKEKYGNSEGQPSELHIQESSFSISQRSTSPTAPPPLPPRPVISAPPPPLPARPASSNSTLSPGTSPISPQTSTGSPGSNSPHQGKKGSAKKTPPALPPRVDLNEKLHNSSSNKKEAFPDPFGGDVFDQKFNDNKVITQDGSSDWATSWPNSQKVSSGEKGKDLSDPFSEDFFTNFDFPQKSSGTTVDPFASTKPSSGLFPSEFGEEEGEFDGGDPFKNDSFAAFSADDPFSDVSDPFADKGVLGEDPFSDSPRKPQSGNAFTLESLVASDEADSFA